MLPSVKNMMGTKPADCDKLTCLGLMRRWNVSAQQNEYSQRVSFSPRTSFAGHLAGILVGLMYTHGPLKKIMEKCAGTEQNTFGLTTS